MERAADVDPVTLQVLTNFCSSCVFEKLKSRMQGSINPLT